MSSGSLVELNVRILLNTLMRDPYTAPVVTSTTQTSEHRAAILDLVHFYSKHGDEAGWSIPDAVAREIRDLMTRAKNLATKRNNVAHGAIGVGPGDAHSLIKVNRGNWGYRETSAEEPYLRQLISDLQSLVQDLMTLTMRILGAVSDSVQE